MEHLKLLADKWSQTDGDQAGGAQSTDEATVEATDTTDRERAEKLAGWMVKAVEFGFRRVEGRIGYGEKVYRDAAEQVAPALDKHGLRAGVGRVPMAEEIAAGLFFGRLWRNTWAKIRELWEQDKAKDGKKREHQTAEPAPAVSGEERTREEPNLNPSQWDQANG